MLSIASGYRTRSVLNYAYDIARQSPDPSTQNGASLVDPNTCKILTSAFNGLPPGIEDRKERWQWPDKHQYVEHAERAVIYKAAKKGIATARLWLFCPWAACPDCARAIICAGISRLVVYRKAYEQSSDIWRIAIDSGLAMLREAAVEVVDFTIPLYQNKAIRFNGKEWLP